MKIINILIIHNKNPKDHDLFTNQAKAICKKLNDKIKIKITWVVFPSHDTINTKIESSEFIDSREYEDIFEIIKHVKPDFIVINGSLDFHNVSTSLTAKYLKIPLIVLFLRNFQHVKSKSSIESLKSRTSVLTSYEITSRDNSKIISSKELRKFYLNQFWCLFKVLRKTKKNIFSSIVFLAKYSKLVVFEHSPVDNIVPGKINLCIKVIINKVIIK